MIYYKERPKCRKEIKKLLKGGADILDLAQGFYFDSEGNSVKISDNMKKQSIKIKAEIWVGI